MHNHLPIVLSLLVVTGVAAAQGYPVRPIRLIVPFPPGAATSAPKSPKPSTRPTCGTARWGEGAMPTGNTPEQFAAFIQSELSRWTKVIKDAGIKMA